MAIFGIPSLNKYCKTNRLKLNAKAGIKGKAKL
jgi:hypothetical protein